MRIRSQLVLTGLGATLLMALAVGTTSARNLSVTNQNFRSAFNQMDFRAGEIANTCRVTLEGSLHSRTMPKVEGSLIGYVTRVITGNCQLGTTILTETLPWHVRYISFSGRLPDITLITVKVRGAFRVSFCLAATDFTANFHRDPATGSLTSVSVPLTSEIPLTGIFCPEPRRGSLRANGEGSVSLQGTTGTRIHVFLI